MRRKKAHSLVGFCVLVKDHFCHNNAFFGIPQRFFTRSFISSEESKKRSQIYKPSDGQEPHVDLF